MSACNLDLSTDRLRLRPCSAADVDALYELWRLPDVRRYLLDDQLVDREWVVAYLADSIAASARGFGLWVLELKPGGELSGFVSLREIEKTAEVEIYYGLAPQFWGRGLAQEASQALIRHGFETLGLERIWIRTDTPNTASIRVAQRLGMKPAEDPGGTALVSFVLERV